MELLARLLKAEPTTAKRSKPVVIGVGEGQNFMLVDMLEGIGHRLSGLEATAHSAGAFAGALQAKKWADAAMQRERRLKKRVAALEAKLKKRKR